MRGREGGSGPSRVRRSGRRARTGAALPSSESWQLDAVETINLRRHVSRGGTPRRVEGEGGEAAACGAWVVSVAGRAGGGSSKESNVGKAGNGVDEIGFFPKIAKFFLL